MRVALATVVDCAVEPRAHDVVQGIDRRLEQGDLNQLALSSMMFAAIPLEAQECGHDAAEKLLRGQHIGDRPADLLRSAVRVSSDVHKAAHCLNREVKSCLLRPLRVCRVPGYLPVDQPRLLEAQGLVIKSKLGNLRWNEVLDQDVGLASQLSDNGLTLGLL